MQPESVVDRVRGIAEKAKAEQRSSANAVLVYREWWRVRRPVGEEFDVFMCPAANYEEMRARYPDCGILPGRP